MTEEEIKLQMRLYAVEILAVNLLALSCLQAQDPHEAVARARRGMIDGARGHAFHGLEDAAMSDLFSAELETAADRLMEMVSGQIDQVLKSRKTKNPGRP